MIDGRPLAELRELSGSMTTPEMAREVEELRKDCAGYADKLERIKSATNHVTPEEKEKVKRGLGLSRAGGRHTKPVAALPCSPAWLAPGRQRCSCVGSAQTTCTS